MKKTLYEITGDIKDINTVLINLDDLRKLEQAEQALPKMYAAAGILSNLLAESLDTTLMLSEKLTNAQARWLGREDAQKTN